MGAVELAFALLLGASLGWLAAAGRGPSLPAWAELFAPGVMGWICGVQGILFQRQSDYMLAYLVEARGHPRLWYVAWALACVALALLASRMVQGVRVVGSPPARGKIAFAGGVLVAACSALLWPRLLVFGSTLEFTMGLGRPLSTQPAVQVLLGVTALGTLIPLIGAVGLVAIDGLRNARSTAVRSANAGSQSEG